MMESTQTEIHEGTLRVDGATLYYRRTGTGPLLLLLAGGDGDASAFDLMVPHLRDRFTLLTHDRRGLSRSLMDDPNQPISIAQHVEDAHQLLAAVTKEPVFVFGGSFGALIALELAARHPDQVKAVVAFEPPSPYLIPDETARNAAIAARASVMDALRAGGAPAAMQRYAQMLRVNIEDREPDMPWTAPSPQRGANLTFFLQHDQPAVAQHRVDVATLQAAPMPVIVAAGEGTRSVWIHESAEALAAALGRPLVEFQGGHSAFVMRPRAFAAQLRSLLGSDSSNS